MQHKGSARENPGQNLAPEAPYQIYPLTAVGLKEDCSSISTNMQIKEEEFSTDLNPTRATITVSLEVIEGPNLPFLYTKTLKEVMSALNLANIADIANTIVPA